jgi:membrane fusion protein (multidrug efflux system)
MTELNDPNAGAHASRKKRAKYLRRKKRLRWLKIAAVVVVVIIVLIWAAFWLLNRLNHVSSKDAQVAAHVITVSSRLSGRVVKFPLIIGDRLDKNEPVAQLYSKPDKIKLAELKAHVASVKHKLAAQQAHLKLAKTRLAGGIAQTKDVLHKDIAAKNAARAEMIQAQKNAQRTEKLYKVHGASKKQRDNARYTYRAAKARYAQSQRSLQLDRQILKNAQNGMMNGATLPNPDVLRKELKTTQSKLDEAKASLEHQRTRVHDLQVRSPVDGVVDKTFINAGDYVAAGQPILMMHDPKRVWILAKIKETEIHSLRVGQPVAIDVDARPNTHYSGHIRVIGHAATNQFALLPNPNPSGNFTKVTQRIPVRIHIDHGPLEKLSPGMMVEVHIDITHHSDQHNKDHSSDQDGQANG